MEQKLKRIKFGELELEVYFFENKGFITNASLGGILAVTEDGGRNWYPTFHEGSTYPCKSENIEQPFILQYFAETTVFNAITNALSPRKEHFGNPEFRHTYFAKLARKRCDEFALEIAKIAVQNANKKMEVLNE